MGQETPNTGGYVIQCPPYQNKADEVEKLLTLAEKYAQIEGGADLFKLIFDRVYPDMKSSADNLNEIMSGLISRTLDMD